MRSPTLFINRVKTADRIIMDKTEGLTHADSMLQLPFPANCMNWILGHILIHRIKYLGAIDGASEPDEDEFALYGFESEPLTDSNKAVPLETLLARLDEASEQIVAALATVPESRLDEVWLEEVGLTVEEEQHFYVGFHENYHPGQLEPAARAGAEQERRIEVADLSPEPVRRFGRSRPAEGNKKGKRPPTCNAGFRRPGQNRGRTHRLCDVHLLTTTRLTPINPPQVTGSRKT